MEIRTAHTAELPPAMLKAVRSLLDAAFEGDFSDHDWEHALGGVHALTFEDGELGALSTTDQARALCARRGWIRWTGPTEPAGDGAVYVLPASARINPAATLTADQRDGDIW